MCSEIGGVWSHLGWRQLCAQVLDCHFTVSLTPVGKSMLKKLAVWIPLGLLLFRLTYVLAYSIWTIVMMVVRAG